MGLDLVIGANAFLEFIDRLDKMLMNNWPSILLTSVSCGRELSPVWSLFNSLNAAPEPQPRGEALYNEYNGYLHSDL